MLRINLLPPYVFDKQKKTKVWALWISLLLMTIGIYAFFNSVALGKQAEADDLKAQVQKLETEKKGLDDKTTGVNNQIAETQKKQEFIASAQAWNDEWPKLYSVMRDVTSPKVILRKMYLAAPTLVNIVGWAPSEKEAADWWIQFRNKYTGPTGSFANVSFELPKNGYPLDANNAGAPGAPSAAPSGPRTMGSAAAGFGSGPGGGFGGGASTSGGGANDKDEDPGPGYLEDRLGIYFRVHVTLKAPFDSGKTVPVWGAPADPNAPAAGGPVGLPGGGRRGPMGSAPGGPPPGGAPPASSEDSGGGTGRKGKRGAGGEE